MNVENTQSEGGKTIVFRGDVQVAKADYYIEYKKLPDTQTNYLGRISIVEGDIETEGALAKPNDVLTFTLKDERKVDFTIKAGLHRVKVGQFGGHKKVYEINIKKIY